MLEPRHDTIVGGEHKEKDRRGDIVVVMPRITMAAVDIYVSHTPVLLYAAVAGQQARKICAWVEERMWSDCHRDICPGARPSTALTFCSGVAIAVCACQW